MVPWKTLAKIATPEGALELRQRTERDFLITIDGRVLMTSSERTSELAVATLACKELVGRKAPRVLIGGLGMAYTLRAALDALPRAAQVTVAELTAEVEVWCRGPLAPLTAGAVSDPRVRVVIDDVARVIARAPAAHYDAIVLDLYEGPHARHDHDSVYDAAALTRTAEALADGGILAIWSEEDNLAFRRRMTGAGFTTTVHRPSRPAYVVYLGHRGARKPKRGAR